MTEGSAGVPLSGRDCRVALRAPRNDKSGVCAPRNKSNDRQQCYLYGRLYTADCKNGLMKK
ncbi:MAG: hypothetical protein LBL66_07000 [Clostridiales bacterium]|nr:hypothetical protein [Clostridiales bacterium]